MYMCTYMAAHTLKLEWCQILTYISVEILKLRCHSVLKNGENGWNDGRNL